MTAEVVEGRPVTKENIMGQAPAQLSVGLVYGVPNTSHDVREGARRDYPEDLLHSSRYANSTLPQGASKVRTVCGSSRKHGSVRGCVKNAFLGARCCIGDEGGPFGAGLQEQASNNRKLLPSNDGGGERYGKGVRKSRHVRVRETNASEPLMRPRNRPTDGIKTGAPPLSGRSMAETWLGPCGVRGTGGVTLILALVWNLRTCSALQKEKAQAVAPRGRKYRYAGQGRTVP